MASVVSIPSPAHIPGAGSAPGESTIRPPFCLAQSLLCRQDFPGIGVHNFRPALRHGQINPCRMQPHKLAGTIRNSRQHGRGRCQDNAGRAVRLANPHHQNSRARPARPADAPRPEYPPHAPRAGRIPSPCPQKGAPHSSAPRPHGAPAPGIHPATAPAPPAAPHPVRAAPPHAPPAPADWRARPPRAAGHARSASRTQPENRPRPIYSTSAIASPPRPA